MTGATIAGVCDELHLPITTDQIAVLEGYLQLLLHWNATYNLTAVRNEDGMLLQHLADCLAIVGPLSRHLSCGRLLDVGSGGGLPGVVIATMLPRLEVTCVDAVGKKSAFVRQIAGSLRLANLHAVHARVESLQLPPFEVITCRAFASLLRFVEATADLIAARGVWIAMKAQVSDVEMAAAATVAETFHVEPLDVPGLHAPRCLVWMRRRIDHRSPPPAHYAESGLTSMGAPPPCADR